MHCQIQMETCSKSQNEELRAAGKLFKETEGIDIHSAAAVATASLKQAVNTGLIASDSMIMLNITGGGEELFKTSFEPYYLSTDLIFGINATEEEIISAVKRLYD